MTNKSNIDLKSMLMTLEDYINSSINWIILTKSMISQSCIINKNQYRFSVFLCHPEFDSLRYVGNFPLSTGVFTMST